MKNKKMPIIALALIAIVGIVGGTIAYFTNSETFENLFATKKFSTTIKENFESPDNWVPGTTVAKTVEVKNEGNVAVVVRAKIEDDKGWYNGATKLSLAEKVTVNLTQNSNWVEKDGYYYYKSVVGAGAKTTDSFMESVTCDADATISDTEQTCTYTYTYKDGTTSTGTTPEEGKKVVSREKNCETKSDSYAGATYKMNITVETIQADKEAIESTWGVDANELFGITE